MIDFLNQNGLELLAKIGEHLTISLSALALGCLVAIPVGVLIARNKKLANTMIAITSVFQTIPSLALLAMIVPILGVGIKPAIVALFIYSLLPILRNTVLGMQAVDNGVLDAAKGMGMSYSQVLLKVQVPLAMPIIMAGVRLSGVYVLSWATLAAYIGAGGLGDYIFAGLNNFKIELLVAGTVPVMILAFVLDAVLGKLEMRLTPKTASEMEVES